jgi:AcrR family transcriptional regulator
VSVAATRLPAAERRQALIDTAVRVFSSGSYRCSTTSEIARAAGVSEPILYRHFGSKRELYIAAVDHVWAELRRASDEAIAAEPDPARWVEAIGSAYNGQSAPGELFVQSLAAAEEDAELRKHVAAVMRDLHGYVVEVIERAQASGGVLPERDPQAEAWMFIAGGMLGTLGRRLGLLCEADFARIGASRLEWLTGDKA